MLVSVVIPVHNAASYLRETVESVFASTYRPLEIVMVDDGSTDDSRHIAEQLVTEAASKRIQDVHFPDCLLFSQPNAGVSAARNHAIKEAHGTYILPLDADDLISPTYIAQAVDAMQKNKQLRIVGCRAKMFGEVNKEWKLPDFTPSLIARKNMIPVSSLFRRIDWERVGGFCEEDIYREDWDFWLSLLELDMGHPELHSGAYQRLPEIGLFYRVRHGSRRTKAKAQKEAIVDAINKRHPQYMQHYLGGPLHYHRSWSRFLNFFRTEKVVGDYARWHEGTIIHQGRNTLIQNHSAVCKRFAIPPIWKGLLYGLFVKSKAQRSYEYALRLKTKTPAPIAYREVRYIGILRESEYVSRLSECTHTFNELIGHPEFPNRTFILQSIGRFTASLHQQGILHKDYSGGNILFNDSGTKIEIVDLNRVHFYRNISKKQGLKNFERLNIDRQALCIMAEAYADSMGLNPTYCAEYIIAHRWHKHIKQGITNL
ncbi:MAG: glycosyltransferase [Paludibacteraceae bacterium]